VDKGFAFGFVNRERKEELQWLGLKGKLLLLAEVNWK